MMKITNTNISQFGDLFYCVYNGDYINHDMMLISRFILCINLEIWKAIKHILGVKLLSGTDLNSKLGFTLYGYPRYFRRSRDFGY